MRFSSAVRAGLCVAGLSLSAWCVVAQPPSDSEEPKYVLKDAEPIPPRAAPTDYMAHGKVGKFTIAAEFTGHAMPAPTGVLTSEDYVSVEVGVYGPAGSQLTLSADQFSIRINGKKELPAQPYGLLVKSLKDPDYEQPKKPESKSSIGGQPGEPPPSTPSTPKLPIEVLRSIQQRIQKVSMPEGERPLPQAGLLYFQYRGKTEKVESVELSYEGPAGKTKIKLQ